MRILYIFILSFSILSCNGQEKEVPTKNEMVTEEVTDKITPVDSYYEEHKSDSIPSSSHGHVSKGQLKHGRLIPFSGENFIYFDSSSYLSGRAFGHEKVVNTITQSFESFENSYPKRTFRVMELSNEHGGKIFPHRTHQNGLSVDLMMPLIKDGEIYTKEDDTGIAHYVLDFNDSGQLTEDPSVSIDFELVAAHILQLEKAARKNGLKIKKVIINTNLKDELFATESGKKLKQSGVYIVRNLEPLINDLHDDHYHVDFEIL